MKYPKKIRILGKEYQIKYVKHIEKGKVVAQHWYGEGIIKIATITSNNKKRCKDEIITSIIHESLHAINNRTNLSENKNTNLNEEQVTRLSTAIQALLTDNPKLKKLL